MDNFSTEIGDIKNYTEIIELKHTHTHRMRNSVDDLNRRIERKQERIGELAERTIEIIKINN